MDEFEVVKVLYRVEKRDGTTVYVYSTSGWQAALLVKESFAVSVVYGDMVLTEYVEQ